MAVLHAILNALFFLAAAVWLGGLVVLVIAARLIDSAMKGRRTEGRQLVGRLRGIFQRMELVLIAVLWAASVARGVLAHVLPDAWGGAWTPADGMVIGLLVLPTLAAAISTFYLTPAARKAEAQLGGYADKNEQIRVRKTIAALFKQAEMLTWLKAVVIAAVLLVAVVALGA